MPVAASPESGHPNGDRVIPRAIVGVDAAHVVQEARNDPWLIQTCEAELVTVEGESECDHVRNQRPNDLQ